MARVRVLIVPAGFGDLGLLSGAVDSAAAAFDGIGDTGFLISVEGVTLPLSLVDLDRLQYKAEEVNRYMHRLFEDYLKPLHRIVVTIVNGDGYVPGLNFVFGLASPTLGVASVYTRRLEAESKDLFMERLAKEIVHETGHLLGLGHCSNPACVMSFSNSVADVDRKGIRFCSSCRLRLSSRIG